MVAVTLSPISCFIHKTFKIRHLKIKTLTSEDLTLPNRETWKMNSSYQKYYPVPLPTYNFICPENALSEAENFLKKMLKRHSIRDFSNADVNEKIIQTAIKTAARAPSGANQQPWHFVAIRDIEMKRKIRNAAEAEEQNFSTAAEVMSGWPLLSQSEQDRPNLISQRHHG